jgi:hypothetical protein
MFLRHTKRKKDGKKHRYWSIVENRRIGGCSAAIWMGNQALAVIVAWTGGRPRPRLRSSAARRR